VFSKVSIRLAQELTRSQKLDANKDPVDPLEQVAILGNHPYLLRSLFFSVKSSFIMETTSISHNLRQVSLESFATGMSVVRMTVRISSVNDFEAPWISLCDCMDTHENLIGSQGNTHTHTHGCLRIMMHRLHIVVLHPHFKTFWPLESLAEMNHEDHFFDFLLAEFFFESNQETGT